MSDSLTIDPSDADPHIPIEQAHRHVLGRPHRATIWRWITRGIQRNGETIRLRTIVAGRRRFTHPAWIEEFLAACNGEKSTPRPPARRRSHELARAQLDALFSNPHQARSRTGRTSSGTTPDDQPEGPR